MLYIARGSSMARYKRGATPKLTIELIDLFSRSIREGECMEAVAKRGGVSKDTLYRWLRAAKGMYPTTIQLELLNAVNVALDDVKTTRTSNDFRFIQIEKLK